MSWLTEDSTIVLILGGVTLVVLVAALIRTGRGTFLYAIGGTVAVLAGLMLLERFIVTQQEEIEDTLQAVAAALETNDPVQVQQLIVPSATQMRSDVEFYMSRGTFSKVVLVGPRIEVDSSTNPPIGRVKLVVRPSGVYGGTEYSGYPIEMELELQRDRDTWLLSDYKFVGRAARLNRR